MHNASVAKLGTNLSSAKIISDHNVDPASFLAGLAISMASTGLPSLLKSAGVRMGVSLGPSLSDHKKLAVIRSGERVPVRLALKRATGLITITSFANLVSGTDDVITVGATAFTAQAGAATLGQPTFQAASSNNATATSLAAQINAHATAGALVYAIASSATVRLYSKVAGVGSTGTGNDIALTYTDNDAQVGATLSEIESDKLAGGSNTVTAANAAVVGAKAYINDVTGEFDIAMSGFSTVSDATYVTGAIEGLDESDASVAAAIVDMSGGL